MKTMNEAGAWSFDRAIGAVAPTTSGSEAPGYAHRAGKQGVGHTDDAKAKKAKKHDAPDPRDLRPLCRKCRYYRKSVCSECVGHRYFEPKNGVVARWS